ncbi:receptor-interacting serine/threonine-protein kinase 3 [Hyperolius riggenbachi]|uniref:receptor-interacting serine/threonine-protein kinase 3 n=1 Tax=Hyperolius riggenbachi TaxID=752182 RepID=UPI0035A3CF1B
MNDMKVVPYESLEEWKAIGQGSFGEVYKVRHKDLKTHFAVKKLKQDGSFSTKDLRAEAEKIRYASENDFVVSLLGIVENPPCLVMKLMKYGSLGTLIENVKNEIPYPLRYRILHEVAIGMNWLHSLTPPLLHLDLKPTNVLLDDALHPKITDFGLSRYTSTSSSCGEGGEIGGTLDYMPPEAFLEGYSPSESTDIYSFAILSAVVLRGEEPYLVFQSELIKSCVCRGQRPCFQSLGNVSSVKNLDKAIELTKRCWDSNCTQRPPFAECCSQWENILSAFEEKDITLAELDTVKLMVNCTDPSTIKTNIPSCSSAASANTSDVAEIIDNFQTLHFSQPPSALQKSAPIRPANSNLLTSPRQYSPQPYVPRPQVPRSGQPLPSSTKGPMNPRHVQTAQNYNGRVHSPYSGNMPMPLGRGQPQAWYMPQVSGFRTNGPAFLQGWLPQQPVTRNLFSNFRFPSFPSAPSTVNSITITDSNGPVQIGDGNVMDIGQHGTLRRPVMQQPAQTATGNYPPPSYHASNITVTDSTGPVQIGDGNVMDIRHSGTLRRPVMQQSAQTAGRPYAAPPTSYCASSITVTGNSGPLQIGDRNEMLLMETSHHQGSNTNTATPRPDQMLQRSSPSPIKGTETPHALQVCPVSQAKETTAGETQGQTEPAKPNDPLIQATHGQENISTLQKNSPL